MSQFIEHTISDIRRGRQSWRVISALSGASFFIAVVAAVAQQGF
ncbi:MAG TPA: hypothetical protein VGF69_12160 [Thermoanaerobaculia bacterium]|jgi:hypothetical protein